MPRISANEVLLCLVTVHLAHARFVILSQTRRGGCKTIDMETMETFLPLKENTIGYCTGSDMAEPSIGIDDEEDHICELKITSSSKIINDRKNCLSDEGVDSVVEDVHVSVESAHPEPVSSDNLHMISHSLSGKEQDKVPEATKVNGIIHHGGLPYYQEINSKILPLPESLCLDSSSLSNISNSTETEQSSNSLILKQNTSFSNIVSPGCITESDSTVADRDTYTPAVESAVTESCEDNDIISASRESTGVESLEEKQNAVDASPNRSRNVTVTHSQESPSEMTNVEAASEHIYHDKSPLVDVMQEPEAHAANCTTASENVDVEDMQVEGHQLIGKIGECFTISETEMDCCLTEAEAAGEVEAAMEENEAAMEEDAMEEDEAARVEDEAPLEDETAQEVGDVGQDDTSMEDEAIGEDEIAREDDATKEVEDIGKDETASDDEAAKEVQDVREDEIAGEEGEAVEKDVAPGLNNTDDMTVSVQKADPVSPSYSCHVLPSQIEMSDMSGHHSPDHDVISVDESAPIDDACPDLSPHTTDEDTCGIRIADSRSVAAEFSDYSASHEIICLEESDIEQEIVANESDVNCKESDCVQDLTAIVNNCSEQTKQPHCTQSSIDEINDHLVVEDISENLDKLTPESQCKSLKVAVELSSDQRNQELFKGHKSSTKNDQSVIDPSCEFQSNDCAPDETTKVQENKAESDSCLPQIPDQISGAQHKVSDMNKISVPLCATNKVANKLSSTGHSQKVSAGHSKNDSHSCKEGKSDDKVVNSEVKKETADKLEVKDSCVDSKVGNLDKVIKDKPLKEERKLSSKDEVEKAEIIDEDDEVVFVDEAEESAPTDLLAQKSPIDSIVIDENSTISATEPLIERDRLIEKQGEQSAEVMTNLALEDVDEQMEISSIEDACNSETPAECGRKRNRAEDDASSAPKRSRLEEKSKENPRETAPSEVCDSDDDVILEEEVPPVAVSAGAVTATPKDDSMIVLSSEALQNLISLRVRAFLKSHKQTNLEKLNIRTRGMQSASNLWRETAKHLEKSITNLLALNQKLEKNKKLLESRSVGIQVGGDSQGLFRPAVNGIYSRIPEAASPSVGHNSRSVSMNPLLHTPQAIGHHQTQASPSSNPALRNPTSVTQPPAPRIQNRPGRPVSFSPSLNAAHNLPQQRPVMAHTGRMPQNAPFVRPPIRRQSLNNVVNLIDLTDDDDTTRKTVTRAPTVTASQPGTQNISKLAMGGKTTSPGNSNFKPGHTHQGSNGQTLHPSPGHQSQHPTSNKAGTGASNNSSYQLVTITNSASNPGGNLAPGSRPAAAPSAQHVSPSKSNVPANKKTLPQSVPSPAKTAPHSLPPSFLISNKHPAPLPSGMDAGNAPPSAKRRPPKPGLKISRVSQGIVLSWNMPPLVNVEKITSYQLFAYQESDASIPKSSLWKKVGDVKALPLPMACTLTQFQEGNKYHFAVRAVDQYGRWGSYSDASSIFLGSSKT